MDHPLSLRLSSSGLRVVFAWLLGLFSASVSAQTLSGLSARQSGTSIVLELATVSSVDIGALNFFYSEDGGSHWQPIHKDCLTPVSSRSVEWAVLECLGIDGFTGNNIRFKASSKSCSGAVRFDGYTYNLVAIGNQCWFKENLRTEHYANGDEIPGGLIGSEWASTSSGAQAVYGNNDVNLEAYGRLYNWHAVDDSRGLCPSGWHVPTDGEWTELTDYLGGSSVAGAAMKSSPSDTPSWDGSNTSGFSALPGGLRYSNYGGFSYEGDYGSWWSASPHGTSLAWYRELYSGYANVYRNYNNQRNGFSVRCVRDE